MQGANRAWLAACVVGLACSGAACGLDTTGLDIADYQGGPEEAGGVAHDASGVSAYDSTSPGNGESMNDHTSPSVDAAYFDMASLDVGNGGAEASGLPEAGNGEDVAAGDGQSVDSSNAPDTGQDAGLEAGNDAGTIVHCTTFADCPAPLACDYLTGMCTDVCSYYQPCGAGCCDGTGHCQSGTMNNACGPPLSFCFACNGSQTCAAPAMRCTP